MIITREELDQYAKLFQAQASGKVLEARLPAGDQWEVKRLTEITTGMRPECWRVSNLPPKPSQEWLDKHGVELTGEYRDTKTNELAVSYYEGESICPQVCSGEFSKPRWILRRRAPQVRPWTLDTMPLPLVVKRKSDGVLFVVISARAEGAGTVGVDARGEIESDEMYAAAFVRRSWGALLLDFTQRDGSPCGEVVK